MADGYTGPPAVDFYSMLSGLGDTIAAKRTAQAKKDAFAAATTPGADGKIDYGRAILGLAQVDPQAATLLASRQNHDDTLKQQAIDNARNAARDTSSDSHWNSDYALRKAAGARADDPTPDNFVADKTVPGGYRPIGPADPAYIENVASAKARAAATIPPDNFTRQPDGTLAPMPGGPADPLYKGRVIAEEERVKGDQPKVLGPGSTIIIPNKASEGPIFKNSLSGGLSDDALNVKASQWNNGDYEGATKNVGRGAQGGATLEAIANKAASLLVEKGMSPEEAAAQTSRNMQAFKASSLGQGAEARTAGVREANLNLILRAADAAIPAALEASAKVSRTGFVPLNKVIQGGEVMTSNPDLKRFGMANLQLAEHWARAMNPTGVMRESDRDKALQFLGTADSEPTYRAAVDQLRTQILRERDAVKGASVTPPSPSFSGGAPASPQPGAYVWTPNTGLISKP